MHRSINGDTRTILPLNIFDLLHRVEVVIFVAKIDVERNLFGNQMVNYQ